MPTTTYCKGQHQGKIRLLTWSIRSIPIRLKLGGNILKQGWEFAHFAQIKWATVSDLLRSLKTNERLWANRSRRSRKISNCERIAQAAQDKWATHDKCAIRSKKIYIGFCIKKWEMWANHSGRSPKMSDVSELLRSLAKNERPWAIRSSHSEEMRWAIMSESLRSLIFG